MRRSASMSYTGLDEYILCTGKVLSYPLLAYHNALFWRDITVFKQPLFWKNYTFGLEKNGHHVADRIQYFLEWKWLNFESNLTIIGSYNGLSPDWHQAITWTNTGILSIGPLGLNFSEIKKSYIFIKENAIEFTLVKQQPFCLSLNVLIMFTSNALMCFSHHAVVSVATSTW